MMRVRLENNLPPPLTPIGVRGVVSSDLDTPFPRHLPRPSESFLIQSRSMRMTHTWQALQFSEDELRQQGFSEQDIAWLRDVATRVQAPLGMIVGDNPLLEIPGKHIVPLGVNPAHAWVYNATIWQLIGSENRANFSVREINALLAETPYRIGMPAITLFVSTGS